MRGSMSWGRKAGLTLVILTGIALCLSIVLMRRTSQQQKPLKNASQPARKPWGLRDDGIPYLYGDGWFDDSGYFFGVMFTKEPGNPESLAEIRSNVGGRASRGVSYLKRVLADMPRDEADSALHFTQLHLAIGGLYMYDGKFDLAKEEFETARKLDPNTSELVQANYEALLGVVALRRGEVENCVECRTEESCIFPLSLSAVHKRTRGSREAISRFTAYLEKHPKIPESSGCSALPR